MMVREKNAKADFVVVGGGMAGLCAAVAAARNGAKTLIIQDRPMFGGNASSEIRMWICGAHGPNRKETGLLEELQLDNLYFNPELHYTIWDDVMYNFVRQQPNLSMLLNSSVESVEVEDGKIRSVTAWRGNSLPIVPATASCAFPARSTGWGASRGMSSTSRMRRNTPTKRRWAIRF